MICGIGYFSRRKFTATQDWQNSVSSDGFRGHVDFNLGKIDHPQFSKIVIKGNFPRIQPKLKRLHITAQEKQNMKSYLLAWYNEFFDAAAKFSNVDQLTETATALVGYANPNHELGSSESDLLAKVIFWIELFDEVLETSVCNKTPFSTLENGILQLIPVFEFQEKEFVEVGNFPSLRPLFNSFVHLRDSFVNYNSKLRGQLWSSAHVWQRYFEAARWYSIASFGSSHSENMYRYWRRIIGFGFGVVEHIWILSGGPLPEAMFKSVSFSRLRDTTDSIIASTNDLLGLRNELDTGVDDNWLLFKIFKNGIPAERATEEVCTFITNELRDYELLKKSLLVEFSFHPGLVSFLEILDSFVDGHNRYYTDCARYKVNGSVRLID